MSLQGTFDTLPVTELLGLLVRSRKTGLLHVESRASEGRVWLLEGRCRAVESGALSGPAATPGDLQERLVDACFDVARQESGSFRFADGGEPPWPTAYDVCVDDALEEVDRLLEEWQEIRGVIPSLDARPRLSPELRCQSMTVDAAQWRVLAALDGSRTVDDVISGSQRSLMEVCVVLRDMVERGAVELITAPTELAPDAADPAAPDPGVAAPDESVPDDGVPDDGALADGALADLADLARSAAGVEFGPREPEAIVAGPAPGTDAVVHPVEPYGPGVDPSEPTEAPHPATHRPVGGASVGKARAGVAEARPRGRKGAPDDGDDDGEPESALPDGTEAGDDDGSKRDRGAMLRLFSTIRDL